jgi:hypothetical protein
MSTDSGPTLMTISCGLAEGKHRKQMGTAVWLFLWLVKRQTGPDGAVRYGRPLSSAEIAADLEFDDARNVRRLFARLAVKGYVTLRHTPAGPVVRIANPKKRFRAATPRTELSAVAGGAAGNDRPNTPARTDLSAQTAAEAKIDRLEPPARTELSAGRPGSRINGSGINGKEPPRTEMTGQADKNVRGHHKDRARDLKVPSKQPQDVDSSPSELETRQTVPQRPARQPPRREPGRAAQLVPAPGLTPVAGCLGGAIEDTISPARALFESVLEAVAPGHDAKLPNLVRSKARERDPGVSWLDLAALLAIAKPEGYAVRGNGFWPTAVANLMDGPVYAALAGARERGYPRMALEGGRTERMRKALRIVADFHDDWPREAMERVG